MSTAARIDELRKKFEENPRRYFAPLANELRKAGDLVQAIALCREHLPKQPGHMSGYIVFGQALYESGALDEARSIFEQALALDAENLIALRHLGDIAKATGDTAAARRWYERVLDADPRNDDIASQLASLAAVPTPVSVRPNPAVSTPFLTPSNPMPAFGLGAMPTPDAALRAVDFDVVNARIAHYTPLDLDAIESAGAFSEPPTGAPQTFAAPRFGTPIDLPAVSDGGWEKSAQPEALVPTTPLSSAALGSTPAFGIAAFAAPAFGPLPHATPQAAFPTVPTPAFGVASASATEVHDADVLTPAFGAPSAGAADVHDALNAFAEHDPSDQMPDHDVGFFQTPRHSPVIATPAADAADDTEFAQYAAAPVSESFEEGIIAPEWLVTADLLARVSAPKGTPPVIDITPDAVHAFGREPHDPELLVDHLDAQVDHGGDAEISAFVDPPNTQLIAVAAPTPLDSIAIGPSFGATNTDGEGATVESIFSDTAQDSATDHPDTDRAAAIEQQDAVDPSDSSDPSDSFDSFDLSDAAQAAEEAAIAALPATPWDDASDEPAITDVAESTNLPWLAAADAVDSDDKSQRALEEIADAFASDARSVGDDADVVVTSIQLNQGGGAEVSFADVLEVLEADDESNVEQRQAEVTGPTALSDDSPAFVTETMAELLVSQGFLARATTVYEELTRRHPYDPVLSSRLAELRDQLSGKSSDSAAARDAPMPASFVDVPTPAYATPAYSPSPYDTPIRATPLVTPSYPTPTYSTPASASVSFEASLMTARERFAQLAARRVPRRTPAQANAVVAEPLDGLSSLFGESDHGDGGDDAAARALADAFAPISETDAASGAMLDFGESESAELQPPVALSQPERPTPNAGVTNAGFAFDRFFPDPATQSAPPAMEETIPDPPPPVGDDLAQFSAWLKGLGTT